MWSAAMPLRPSRGRSPRGIGRRWYCKATDARTGSSAPPPRHRSTFTGGSSVLSVIMPTYNQAECLEPTLASLARQTLGPEQFEVVVVDDASVQDIEAVVRRYSDTLQLRYVRHATRSE